MNGSALGAWRKRTKTNSRLERDEIAQHLCGVRGNIFYVVALPNDAVGVDQIGEPFRKVGVLMGRIASYLIRRAGGAIGVR